MWASAEGYQLKTTRAMVDEMLLMLPRLLVVDFLIRLRIIAIYLVLGGHFANIVFQGERLQSSTPRHWAEMAGDESRGNWFGSGS